MTRQKRIPEKMHPSPENALHNLAPGAHWSIEYKSGDSEYEIKWLDEKIKQPSDAAIRAEIKKLQAEFDSSEYRHKRALEYPEIGDQLDALFHAGVFPEEMQKKIAEVKKKYPKWGE